MRSDDCMALDLYRCHRHYHYRRGHLVLCSSVRRDQLLFRRGELCTHIEHRGALYRGFSCLHLCCELLLDENLFLSPANQQT